MGYAVLPGFEPPDGVHLILHEGDERGNHYGRPVHDQGRKLIAKGFATACGHEHKRVPALHQVLDNGLLVSLESVVSKERFQFSMEDVGIDGHTIGS